MMRRIAALTTGRQDYGILRSTCRALRDDPRFELLLIVGGTHLGDLGGAALRALSDDGLANYVCLDAGRQTPTGQMVSMIESLTTALEKSRPEALMLVGDRSETASAALAATVACVPLIHLHGGEETEGAIDNVLRHAITKLSHLHLVSHPIHARRVLQMGEADATVHVVGAPGLDNLRRDDLPDRATLERELATTLPKPTVIVTHHPTTLGGSVDHEVAALVAAMDDVEARYIITLPNRDAGASRIRAALSRFAERHPGTAVVEALGPALYFGLLAVADAVIGNSSSALIEAPVFGLPAVNVGDRQKGRLRGANVIDVEPDAGHIAAGLRAALAPDFRRTLERSSPYGDGRSAARILEIIAGWRPASPPRKKFVDRSFT